MQDREAGMMTVSGVQGVGKTYQNMHIIKEYVKDKFYNKVKGRRCLIFDTNGEYTEQQFGKNDIPNFKTKMIAIQDVKAWSEKGEIECRRIDAKNLSIAEKKAAVEYLVATFRNGMLVLEDINTYILNMTHMEDIVSGLVNLRHRAVDVLISYQSLRPVEPRIWQNSRWIRMHYQADNVNDIKNKLPNATLFKIAQVIVNNRYFNGDKRFFVYIYSFQNKIVGKFTKQEFLDACKQYLNANKKYIKEFKEMNNVSMEEALEGQANSTLTNTMEISKILLYWGYLCIISLLLIPFRPDGKMVLRDLIYLSFRTFFSFIITTGLMYAILPIALLDTIFVIFKDWRR